MCNGRLYAAAQRLWQEIDELLGYKAPAVSLNYVATGLSITASAIGMVRHSERSEDLRPVCACMETALSSRKCNKESN